MEELADRAGWLMGESALDALEPVHRLLGQLAAVQLALVREVDGSGAAVRTGASSTTAWLQHRLLLTPVAARRMVTVAAAVDGAPPVVRDALTAGLIGVDQVRAIADSLGSLPSAVGPEVVDKAAAALVGYAREFPPHHLARIGQRILWHVAPDLAEEAECRGLRQAEQRAFRDRYVSLTPDGPASVRLHGRLDAEAAAVVRAALDPLCSPRSLPAGDRHSPAAEGAGDGRTLAPWVGGPGAAADDRVGGGPAGGCAPALGVAAGPLADDRVGGGPAGGRTRVLGVGAAGVVPGDDRTAGQRRADALVEVCRLALASGGLPDNGGDRPQVVVTVPFDPVKHALGAGTLDSGERVGADTVRRLACDARILPAVLDSRGQPLDLGRERRLFTGPLRRALVLRDGGCAFPGCDRPARWCDGHHVRHWSDGGETSLANAVLLCGHHHRLIHDERAGWAVHIAPDGRPVFTPPPWLDPARVPRRNHYHRRE